MTTQTHADRRPFQMPVWVGFALFGAIAAFFLWQEHRAHLLGALPYLLLLSCPLIHLFLHRGHGHGSEPASSGGSEKTSVSSHDCHARGDSP
jgi:hypothetical protein